MSEPGGRPLRDRGLANMSGTPSEEPWRPDLAACHVEEYRLPLLGSDDAIVVKTWTDELKRIVHFAMVQTTRVAADTWLQVVRVDCAHEQVHTHRFVDPEREVSKKTFCKIEGPEDVARGYEYAEALIFEQWEENRRRWEHGR